LANGDSAEGATRATTTMLGRTMMGLGRAGAIVCHPLFPGSTTISGTAVSRPRLVDGGFSIALGRDDPHQAAEPTCEAATDDAPALDPLKPEMVTPLVTRSGQ